MVRESKEYLMEICPDVHSNSVYAGNLTKAFSELDKHHYILVIPKSKDLKAAMDKKLLIELNQNRMIGLFFLCRYIFSIELLFLILKIRPRIIHFQHEYAWYHMNIGFIPLIIISKFIGIRVVVTMHSLSNTSSKFKLNSF